MDIERSYDDKGAINGTCVVRRLAPITSTSISLAENASNFHQSGLIVYRMKNRGHHRTGAGSMCGWKACHDTMIRDLYLENPSQPLTGYIDNWRE